MITPEFPLAKEAIERWAKAKGIKPESFDSIVDYINGKKPNPQLVGLIDDAKPGSDIAEDIEFEMI